MHAYIYYVCMCILYITTYHSAFYYIATVINVLNLYTFSISKLSRTLSLETD